MGFKGWPSATRLTPPTLKVFHMTASTTPATVATPAKATKKPAPAKKATPTKKAAPVAVKRAGFTPTGFSKAKLAKGCTGRITAGGQARVTVDGVSMSAFARWAGYNGFSSAAVKAYMLTKGITIDGTTLSCQHGSGSLEAAGETPHHGKGSTVVMPEATKVKAALKKLEV